MLAFARTTDPMGSWVGGEQDQPIESGRARYIEGGPKMKIGIDSYCYHRFFGEVYGDQQKPAKDWTMQDFLKRAKELKVDGVSLESCFFPASADDAWFKDLKAQLDDYGLDRVYAWGHPDGLER